MLRFQFNTIRIQEMLCFNLEIDGKGVEINKVYLDLKYLARRWRGGISNNGSKTAYKKEQPFFHLRP